MKFQTFLNPHFMAAFNKLVELELPVRVAYKISKIQKQILESNQDFVDLRNKIVDKFAEKNEDGSIKMTEKGDITVPKDQVAAFQKEFSDLLDIEFDLPQLLLEDLGSVQLSATELLALSDIITE